MRSMKYILGGDPSKTDDCVDYAYRHKASRIILSLLSVEEVVEMRIVRWLTGSFVWFFDDLTVTYEVVFGGVFRHEDGRRQGLSIENANARLCLELASIRQRLPQAAIEGADRRFDESALYAD